MNDRQHVRFDLPSPVWFELATIAQKRDITVAELISEAVRATVQGDRDRTKALGRTRAEIVRLVGTGLTDAEIAVHLDIDRTYVCNTRRNAGLPLNRPSTANHQKETA